MHPNFISDAGPFLGFTIGREVGRSTRGIIDVAGGRHQLLRDSRHLDTRLGSLPCVWVTRSSVLLITFSLAGQAVAQDVRESADDAMKAQIRNVVLGKATERETRKAIKKLAEEINGAAHPSGANRGLESYSIQNRGPNSLTVTMSLTYYGAFTQKHYSAQATMVVDLADPDEPEIDKIEVSKGNNVIPPNQKNLAELKSRLNKLLEK